MLDVEARFKLNLQTSFLVRSSFPLHGTLGQITIYQYISMNTLYNVCSVHRRTFSTSGGHHEYIEGDFMSRSGDVQYIGGYHEYIRGYDDLCGGIP